MTQPQTRKPAKWRSQEIMQPVARLSHAAADCLGSVLARAKSAVAKFLSKHKIIFLEVVVGCRKKSCCCDKLYESTAYRVCCCRAAQPLCYWLQSSSSFEFNKGPSTLEVVL